jgi:hypothetical protein
MMITPDMVFSYWLLLWYLLYILGIISYSPKLWFLIAIIFMIGIIFVMIYHSSEYTILFIIALILFKLLPFYTMRHDLYKMKDILFGVALFFVYLLWLHYKNVNIIKIYSYRSFKDMPFVHFVTFFK